MWAFESLFTSHFGLISVTLTSFQNLLLWNQASPKLVIIYIEMKVAHKAWHIPVVSWVLKGGLVYLVIFQVGQFLVWNTKKSGSCSKRWGLHYCSLGTITELARAKSLGVNGLLKHLSCLPLSTGGAGRVLCSLRFPLGVLAAVTGPILVGCCSCCPNRRQSASCSRGFRCAGKRWASSCWAVHGRGRFFYLFNCYKSNVPCFKNTQLPFSQPTSYELGMTSSSPLWFLEGFESDCAKFFSV